MSLFTLFFWLTWYRNIFLLYISKCINDCSWYFTETCDVFILHASDAVEWCQYLVSLFHGNHHVQHLGIESCELCEDSPLPKKSMKTFQTCRCILILLSGDLESTFDNPKILESLRKVLKPPNKVIVLFCGVMDKEDFTIFFQDWPKWKQLSSEDDPERYITTVMDTISEGMCNFSLYMNSTKLHYVY